MSQAQPDEPHFPSCIIYRQTTAAPECNSTDLSVDKAEPTGTANERTA